MEDVMRHAYRTLTQDEQETIEMFKSQGLAFWMILNAMPPSRELSLAKTKIEEAVMWATKAMTA